MDIRKILRTQSCMLEAWHCERHNGSECTADTTHCLNRMGDHCAPPKSYSIWKQGNEIKRIKTEKGLSYGNARILLMSLSSPSSLLAPLWIYEQRLLLRWNQFQNSNYISRLSNVSIVGWTKAIPSWRFHTFFRLDNNYRYRYMYIWNKVSEKSTALYRSFLEHCTLTNKAVGTIWRDLSKPPQRIQGPDPRPLWMLGGTPLVLGPELPDGRSIATLADVLIYFWYIIFITLHVCVIIFMASPP